MQHLSFGWIGVVEKKDVNSNCLNKRFLYDVVCIIFYVTKPNLKN